MSNYNQIEPSGAWYGNRLQSAWLFRLGPNLLWSFSISTSSWSSLVIFGGYLFACSRPRRWALVRSALSWTWHFPSPGFYKVLKSMLARERPPRGMVQKFQEGKKTWMVQLATSSGSGASYTTSPAWIDLTEKGLAKVPCLQGCGLCYNRRRVFK